MSALSTRCPRRDGGFTLIEILVVLSIIAILLVFFSPTLMRLAKSGESSKAKAEIQTMKSLIAAYASNTRYGDFPPTDARDTRLKIAPGVELRPNDVNLGVESLVLHFSHVDFVGKSPFTEEKLIVNYDGDEASTNVTRFAKAELFEYADPWGRPYIYFRLRDFDPKAPSRQNYEGAEGSFEAWPMHSEKTGAFAGESDGFQIMSCGPDGEFGNEDDVKSFD
jgi:prepilin-type N-terminal cleavage/methylation domain-containing protein